MTVRRMGYIQRESSVVIQPVTDTAGNSDYSFKVGRCPPGVENMYVQ